MVIINLGIIIIYELINRNLIVFDEKGRCFDKSADNYVYYKNIFRKEKNLIIVFIIVMKCFIMILINLKI